MFSIFNQSSVTEIGISVMLIELIYCLDAGLYMMQRQWLFRLCIVLFIAGHGTNSDG